MKLRGISNKISWSFFEKYSLIFRCITVLTFIAAIIVEKYDSNNHPNPIFVLIMITSGISLFNLYQHALISLATASVTAYFTHANNDLNQPIPNGSYLHFAIFFISNWLSYFLIAFIITYLIKLHSKHQKATLDFITTLAKTLESKDPYTASHSRNVAIYSKVIAEKLKYSKIDCETIYVGALLHDIGKIGISDNILNKPGKLTDEEYELIKQHPTIGYNSLKLIESFNERKILDMILYHHERYDGKGYPLGLKEKEIPQCAAIIAVADSYDAMTSDRIYRKGHSVNFAVSQLNQNSGTQFDPKVVKAFTEYLQDNAEAVISSNSLAIS
jgi:putative nucleotidyltransferase with HDIG domain